MNSVLLEATPTPWLFQNLCLLRRCCWRFNLPGWASIFRRFEESGCLHLQGLFDSEK